jgi:hypothetical protein
MTRTTFRRPPEAMARNKAIADRIEHYTALFDRQIEQAEGWPATFIFPKTSRAHRPRSAAAVS